MAGINFETRVQFRSRIGQFERLLDKAAVDMTRDMVDTTADFAERDAPDGPERKDYGRRKKVNTSVTRRYAGKAGYVGLDDVAAASQETGAVGHFIPNAFGRGITVWHPGNPALRFVQGAVRQMQALTPAMLRRHYPG